MYSTSSGQRRGLLRPHSSHSGPVFRNLPLFGFLAGLVLFFYVFYIYQAQNAELTLAREQNEFKTMNERKLNDQITNLKAQLEKQKSDSESALDSANKGKSSVEEKFKNCSSVRTAQQNEITRLESEKKSYAEKLQTVKIQLEQLNDTLSAMRVVNKNNEETIIRLNNTVFELQNQLLKAKSVFNLIPVGANNAHNVNTANNAGNNLSVPNRDIIQQRILGANSLLKSDNINDGNSQNELKKNQEVLKAKNDGEANPNLPKQDEKNVIAAPAVAMNNVENQANKQLENEEEKRPLGPAGEGKIYDDGDDARGIVFKKDYRDSAEEDNLRAQENKLKPKEDALEPDNAKRKD